MGHTLDECSIVFIRCQVLPCVFERNPWRVRVGSIWALESRSPVGWSFHFETLRMPKLAAEKQFSVQIFEKCFSILICGHYMMIIINWFRKNIVELSTISRIFFPFLSEIIEVKQSYVTKITGVCVLTSH